MAPLLAYDVLKPLAQKTYSDKFTKITPVKIDRHCKKASKNAQKSCAL